MSALPHLGWSSHVYPLEAVDFAKVPDYDGGDIPDEALPGDGVVLLVRPDGPDALLRGRAKAEEAAARGETVQVRVVFRPSIAKWNLPATIVRALRSKYRYHGTGVYHIAPKAIRAMGLERAVRTLDNPQQRKNKDRAASMKRLAASLRERGYDDARPISVHLCRIFGLRDSLRQGHHRISACLECGIERMAMGFCAAGALPRELGGRRA